MTPEQKKVLRESWQYVSALGDGAIALFYERLFETQPGARELFAASDMPTQRRKLFAALELLIASLDRLETILPTLEVLGRRHQAYGVTSEHYDAVGSALLWTLERGLGDNWSPMMRSAWTDAFGLVAGVMRAAANPAETSLPAAA